MKVSVTETEVNRVAIDAVSLAKQKMPFNAQDEQDQRLAMMFLYKGIAKGVNGPLEKLQDDIKKKFRADPEGNKVLLTQNYRLECSEGTAREVFDLDAFIQEVCGRFPEILPHQLKEIAANAKKTTTAPVTIEIDYIGDINRG